MASSIPSYCGIRVEIRAAGHRQQLGLGSSATRWSDGGLRRHCVRVQRNRSYQVCSLATGPAAVDAPGEGRLQSNSQTEKEEIKKDDGEETITSVASEIVSPFSKQQDEQQSGGLYSAETFDLTLENADKVLNEVRPYLIADGGNVEVVSVDDGIISLQLQGACGSCPSSTSTMKMGIERVLREKFGDAFKEVVDVNKPSVALTIEAVNQQVDVLRAAIEGYGGNVEVVSVDSVRGECGIKYKGPVPLGLGIKAAIRDKFPDLNIVLVDP